MATTNKTAPHVALFPCAGMGHLLPFLRVAAMLASRGCTVTIITAQPTVSAAESDQLSSFFAIHPQINRLEFRLLPYKKSKFTNEDPFFIQVESIVNSVHLLHPILSSLSPSLSAIVADFPVTSSISQLAIDLSISLYIVITTSARFFSLMAYLPRLAHDNYPKRNDCIEVPGLGPIPVSNIPPPMLNPHHFFSENICSNVLSLNKVKGILINTFNWFESEAIQALSSSSSGVAPLLPVGPFESFEIGKAHNLPWLDEQTQESVIFISFGSRTALVFLPSGIGNLTPFFQLAVTMASHNCKVTLINIQPRAHAPELPRFSSFISSHPRIELLDFEIRSNTHPDSTISDPFIIHIENINSSLHLLNPILSSLSVSAIFSDFAIATSLSKISADLNIPLYIVSTTSAQFFSLVAYLPVLTGDNPNIFSDSTGEIEVRGLEPISKSKIPPSWMDTSPSNYILTNYLLPNARSLSNVEGVLLNTFDWFEHETLAALKGSRAMNNLPPLFPIGPLKSYDPHKTHQVFSWLDQHKAKSVVYVDFGSRDVMPTDQTTELAKGLDICGCNYLWANPHHIIEEGTKNKGKIIRGWVDQERVLGHPAIGGFVSQCEWSSVMQAAVNGVPILTWPHHGDQRMNAETVEKAGLGVLIRDWGWIGEKLVKGEEIGRVVKHIMENLNVRKKAEIVRGKGGEACEIGGSSENGIVEVIEMLMNKK